MVMLPLPAALASPRHVERMSEPARVEESSAAFKYMDGVPTSPVFFQERPSIRLAPLPFRCMSSGGSTGRDSEGGDRTIGADLVQMFEESALSDVEVICTQESGHVFHAHRLVLAARSPVFKAMFLTGMREKRAGKVFIDDAGPEAISCMLDFAYADECPNLCEEIALEVLKLANKYDMPRLQDICLEFMAQNSRSDNSVEFLAACDSYNLPEFKHLLLAALVDNPLVLHECLHSQSLDGHPEITKQLLTLCVHKMCKKPKDRFLTKNSEVLPFRSGCYMCVREISNMPKQTLGELLFPMVQKVCPNQANKITGMIIELDNGELLPLFESEGALRAKVEEAMFVLKAAEETQAMPD